MRLLKIPKRWDFQQNQRFQYAFVLGNRYNILACFIGEQQACKNQKLLQKRLWQSKAEEKCATII